MDINTLRKFMAERDTFSILETVDVNTGDRSVLQEFDYVIEAPNWTRDGKYLVYNAGVVCMRMNCRAGEFMR